MHINKSFNMDLKLIEKEYRGRKMKLYHLIWGPGYISERLPIDKSFASFFIDEKGEERWVMNDLLNAI